MLPPPTDECIYTNVTQCRCDLCQICTNIVRYVVSNISNWTPTLYEIVKMDITMTNHATKLQQFVELYKSLLLSLEHTIIVNHQPNVVCRSMMFDTQI